MQVYDKWGDLNDEWTAYASVCMDTCGYTWRIALSVVEWTVYVVQIRHSESLLSVVVQSRCSESLSGQRKLFKVAVQSRLSGQRLDRRTWIVERRWMRVKD